LNYCLWNYLTTLLQLHMLCDPVKQSFALDNFATCLGNNVDCCRNIEGTVSLHQYFRWTGKIRLLLFKHRMTVHRDKFLVNEINIRIEFQFYWYYDSTCFGQPFCPSSGVLSRTSALVHFADLMTVCYQDQDVMYQCRCTA
jgi:hypothetical protein